jgi:hypothetical protein
MNDEPAEDYFYKDSEMGQIYRTIERHRKEIIAFFQTKYPTRVEVKTVIGPRRLRIEPKISLRDRGSCQVVMSRGFEELCFQDGIINIEVSDEGEHRGLPNTRYLQVYDFTPVKNPERRDDD